MATAAPRPSGRSSARPTPTNAEGFGLTGPSNPPDPAFNAFRPDLADCGLRTRVIASHYAEPLDRVIVAAAVLRSSPWDDAEVLLELTPGDAFAMLDNSLGWAWGYAGARRRVGYVKSEAVGTS